MCNYTHYKNMTRTVITESDLWSALYTLVPITVASNRCFQMTSKKHSREQAGIGGFAWVARNKVKPTKRLCLPPPSPITVSRTWYPPDIIQGVVTGMQSLWMFLLHFYKLFKTCVFTSFPNLSWKLWVTREEHKSIYWLAYTVHRVHVCTLWTT